MSEEQEEMVAATVLQTVF